MAKDSSFDVVSQVDMQEMDNCVNQVKKEIDQRYDFRGSNASIELGEKEVKISAEDEYKLGAIIDMLRQKMAKRGVPLRALVPGKVEPAAKNTVRQQCEIQQGISKENGKKMDWNRSACIFGSDRGSSNLCMECGTSGLRRRRIPLRGNQCDCVVF